MRDCGVVYLRTHACRGHCPSVSFPEWASLTESMHNVRFCYCCKPTTTVSMKSVLWKVISFIVRLILTILSLSIIYRHCSYILLFIISVLNYTMLRPQLHILHRSTCRVGSKIIHYQKTAFIEQIYIYALIFHINFNIAYE